MDRQANRVDGIEEVFEQADEDRDGQISLTEFRGLMLALERGMKDEAATRSFLEIDGNHDGRIGFDEFRAWWLKG